MSLTCIFVSRPFTAAINEKQRKHAVNWRNGVPKMGCFYTQTKEDLYIQSISH
jgi:hypothetical protein